MSDPIHNIAEPSGSLSKNLCDLSTSKYADFTKVISDMCIKSAEKGNVFLVLNEKEMKEINFPINEHNFKVLKVFLEAEGLIIMIDYLELKIEIFWIDLVVGNKMGKKIGIDILTKFPPITDTEIKNLLMEDKQKILSPKVKKKSIAKRNYCINDISDDELDYNLAKDLLAIDDLAIDNLAIDDSDEWDLYKPKNSPQLNSKPLIHLRSSSSSSSISSSGSNNQSDDNIFDIVVSIDDIRNISNMANFVKEMIIKANDCINYRDKERIIYTMFLTVLKAEYEEPIKNQFIFNNNTFIDISIKKLNELILEGKMHWPQEMIVEFEEIKRQRNL